MRCAVAFWGNGADKAVGPLQDRRARVICDVTLGGTSAKALRELGAPGNDDLRQIERLHAKVYISEKGVVVGSANASRNGIGIDGPPMLVEAGTMLQPDEQAALDAIAWFERLWPMARKVDDAALDIAMRRFRPSLRTADTRVRPGSLLDLVAADPEQFAGLSIVIAHTRSTEKERRHARKVVKAAHPGKTADVEAMPASGMFMGWSRQDLDRWSRIFIELWMPERRLHAYGRRTYFYDDASGTVMSKVRWPAVRKLVGDDLPTPEQIAKADAGLVKRLLARHGDAVFTPLELAAAIDDL